MSAEAARAWAARTAMAPRLAIGRTSEVRRGALRHTTEPAVRTRTSLAPGPTAHLEQSSTRRVVPGLGGDHQRADG
jgi:hypothetical protein